MNALTNKQYLSKSDFKTASSCPTKLFYKKKRYPSTLDDNAYMAMLAEGGYMVGKMAQLYYPEGHLIETLDLQEAVKLTEELLQQESVTLFEPAIYHQGRLVRIDILQKNGNHYKLIEVKSKSVDLDWQEESHTPFRGKRGGIHSKWKPYLEDITYQVITLKSSRSEITVEAYLLCPDKNKLTMIEGLNGLFSIKRQGRSFEVEFHGNVHELMQDNLLTLFPANDEVDELLPSVRQRSEFLLPFVVDGILKAEPIIGKKCKSCEYRTEGVSGFKECWGELAEVSPHLFDLYQMNQLKVEKRKIVDDLIKETKVSLYDIPEEAFDSAYGPRQQVQIQHTRSGTEYRSRELNKIIADARYPLHFIDFETSRVALPYHREMRPYEQVAFQWSCHTIPEHGAEPIHHEWINVEQHFPNFEFAHTLREVIGTTGTVLTWSPHEKTTFKDISRQLQARASTDFTLAHWLHELGDEHSRLLDMCQVTREHFFHPAMRGSNSIKYVLPAVWQADSRLHKIPWFVPYYQSEEGRVINPYKTLGSLPIEDQEEVINEGTGAMLAYQEIMFGVSKDDPEHKAKWRELLLQYCRLDTMAMVMIWTYWSLHQDN
jgi:hypothetical protein